MGTATQLIPAFVDAEPLEFAGREYSKNMRPIRGYPDYWRIIDTQDIVDGPPSQGQLYTRELFLWQAEVLKDENQDFTDTIEAVNLGDYLTFTASEVSGNTEYRYKYTSGVENFQYQHTDVIDSVSLEFDQLGRRIVSFESMGNVYLLWFDPVAGEETLTDFGAGYNPVITTDSYRRTGSAANSERLLFYVKDSTKQIVYRRQDDRYTVEYTLPAAPSDVVELLEVSKNLYGGLTALYCYDTGGAGIGEGPLQTGSFTAQPNVDEISLGSDDNLFGDIVFGLSPGDLNNFLLKIAGFTREPSDETSFAPSTGSLLQFVLETKEVDLSSTADGATLTLATSSLNNFALETSSTEINNEIEPTAYTIVTGSVSNFNLTVTLIELTAETDSATFSLSTGSVNSFTLG